jgi:hypothetical protein
MLNKPLMMRDGALTSCTAISLILFAFGVVLTLFKGSIAPMLRQWVEQFMRQGYPTVAVSIRSTSSQPALARQITVPSSVLDQLYGRDITASSLHHYSRRR